MKLTAAVDTYFLIALGNKDKNTLEVNRRLSNFGYKLFCTNTPLIELAGAVCGKARISEETKTAARKALQDRESIWGIQDYVIKGVPNGIVQKIAEKVQAAFPDLDIHQACTIVEASTAEVAVLLTYDPEILRVNNGKLTFILRDHDLPPIQIVSPSVVLDVG